MTRRDLALESLIQQQCAATQAFAAGLVALADAIRFHAGQRDTPPEHDVSRVPGTEEEDLQRMRERTIANQVSALRVAYAEAGVIRSDAQMRAEAEALYDGTPYDYDEGT